MKKFLKFIAKYILVGILPTAMLGVLVKKLEAAPHKTSEHTDEVLLNAALVSIITILVLGASLLVVRWLVLRGVESGPLVLVVAWLAGIAVMSLIVLPSYAAWKKYGLHYGIFMAFATVLGMLVLGIILVVLLVFFGFGLKLLQS